ncbi:hypothetical protein JX265_002890 [Neoarthrinium moseri]|uniref:LCCL domain-containing protein n=1 Tax=Neoarthrinium moseri TaxID=1658444 RepID=A0A9Q0ASB6_9PEZI|nr:hypothetical protein JX265_002890 [Neoarthrinium moseri]
MRLVDMKNATTLPDRRCTSGHHEVFSGTEHRKAEQTLLKFVSTPQAHEIFKLPRRWLQGKLPHRRQRAALFVGLCLTWLIAFTIFSGASIMPTKVDGTYQSVQQLSCTDSFWATDGGCGIDGAKCAGSSAGSMAFHCPPDCGSTRLQAPYLVGPQEIVDRPLVIGGPIYRADSWICPSAVHAGTLDDARGGCGVVTRMGQTNSYPGSNGNGIASIAVKTYFPRSFKFQLDSEFECRVVDQSWVLPYISATFTGLVVLFTTSAEVFYFTSFGVGFMYVTSTINPAARVGSLNDDDDGSMVSKVAKLMLAFGCAILAFRYSARHVLRSNAPSAQPLLWLGSFWVTLCFKANIEGHDRLTAAVLFLIALQQIYHLSAERRLYEPLSLCIISLSLVAAIVSVAFPRLQATAQISMPVFLLVLFRRHVVQARLLNLSHGLLIGLCVYNLSHLDISTVLANFILPAATTAQSAYTRSSSLDTPRILDPVIHINYGSSNISFAWKTPAPAGVDGISMLVNDVERVRRYFEPQNEKKGDIADGLEWVRTPQAVPDYIRFSWVQGDRLVGWGDVGVWETKGSWSGIGNI